MPNWWQSTKNTKVELYSEARLWKMILVLMQYSLNKDHAASQMTAAKIMETISRLPGCAGQTADTISAFTQVKMEDAPKLLKISQIGMSRHLDSSTMTQMAQIMVQYGRPNRSSWKEFVRSCFLWQDYCGKGNLRKSYWNTGWWEGFQIGNACLHIV